MSTRHKYRISNYGKITLGKTGASVVRKLYQDLQKAKKKLRNLDIRQRRRVRRPHTTHATPFLGSQMSPILVDTEEPETSTPSTPPKIDSKESNVQPCCVCLDNSSNFIIFPCLHLCLCQTCSSKIGKANCPKCRTKIKNIQQVYF
jgi:hypothetical protein